MPTPAYSAIADSEIDPNSPITEELLTKLRDNPISIAGAGVGAPQIAAGAIGALSATQLATDAVTTIKILDGAVTTAKLDTAAVTQDKLKTAVDDYTHVSLGAGLTGYQSFSAAGSYGFFPQVDGASGPFSVFIANEVPAGALATIISVRNDHVSAQSILTQLRYVDASPPYDLGDGDIPLFMFVGLSNGKITQISTSENPPWMGPDIVPHTRRNGKGYRTERVMPCTAGEAAKDPAKLEAYLDALRNGPTHEVEVTKEFKNRNMARRPHPLVTGFDQVLMLDPVSDLVRDLAQMRREGEILYPLFEHGHIVIDNQAIKRAAPFGVTPVALRWKNSK